MRDTEMKTLMPTLTHSRRQFLAATAGLLAAGRAIAADSKEQIIDCHTHFYDPTRPQGVPWPGKDDKDLYRRILPADYRAVAGPCGVTGTVVVEASDWVEDNQWVLDLAEKDPFVLGLVGNLPVGTPEFAAHWQRFTKNPRFLGLRVNSGPLAKGLEDSLYLADLKRISDSNRTLDINGGPELLPLADQVAKRFPDLRIVINHCANVQNRWWEEKFALPEAWIHGMQTVAKHPRVFCKASALVESASRDRQKAPLTPEIYRPVLNVLAEAFGTERLLYGSNWPVCNYAGDYAAVQQLVAEYFAAHRKKFFHTNALAAYQWPT